MLGLQEALQKDEVREQLRKIESIMDSGGGFHPESASVLNVEDRSLRMQLEETLRTMPLREFLAKSDTTGIAGAAYLVPDKIHSDLIQYSISEDLAPKVGFMVNGWAGGGNLKVDIVNNETYKPQFFVSGGKMPTTTLETTQATLIPQTFGFAPRITEDLVEDNAFDLIDYHLRFAAQETARFSNEMFLTVLATAPDGWGTLNSSATGDADETKWTGGTTSDCVRAMLGVGRDKHQPNTMIVTQESWNHSITTTGSANVIAGLTSATPQDPWFPIKIQTLDVAFSNADALHLAGEALGTFTNCITLVFDRNNAILTGRKRWMKLEQYADPVKDIAGMMITSRQDSVTLYKDAIFTLTET